MYPLLMSLLSFYYLQNAKEHTVGIYKLWQEEASLNGFLFISWLIYLS